MYTQVLKGYQLQTVSWMLQQESLPALGLNGLFWETRRWSSDSDAAAAAAASVGGAAAAAAAGGDGAGECYYYAPALGELRLERPPEVRGGVLSEEMV